MFCGFSYSRKITVMDWGNAFVSKRERAADGTVTSLDLQLHLAGDFKKTSKKVTWLAAVPETPLVPVVLIEYDYLITKKKLEEADALTDVFNKKSEVYHNTSSNVVASRQKKIDYAGWVQDNPLPT